MSKVNRVAVTGIGVITPIGKNLKEFAAALKKGVNGIDFIKEFSPDNLRSKLAAEIKDYNPDDYLDKRASKRMDKYTQFAVIAADEAIADAGLDFSKENTDRIGIYIGSGTGGIRTLCSNHTKLLENGPRAVSPLMVPMMIANIAAGDIAIKYGIHGASMAIVTACASSTHSIGEAFRAIKHGYQDVMIAGGSEATLNPLSIGGFQNMTALSTSEDKNAASIPFDKRRGGFVLGEGGAILILENMDKAIKRGAKIYGEIAGYGATTDGYHITSPDPEGTGAAKAMTLAMQEAGVRPEEVDYVNAHGTGTPVNDKFETKAIKTALGKHGDKVYVNSTKSMTGHLLGGAGATEAAACLMQMRDKYLHANINYLEKDEECDLNIVTTNIDYEPKCIISNSLGFGGHNASILIKKV